MLSEIEIAIDFNGPEVQLYHSITQQQNGESFSNFSELYLQSLQQFLHEFISFTYVGTATLSRRLQQDHLMYIQSRFYFTTSLFNHFVLHFNTVLTLCTLFQL